MSALSFKVDNPSFSEIRLLKFSIQQSGEKYFFAINTHKVREVIEYAKVSPLPQAYEPYVAVLELRGVPIPILDIQCVFGNQDSRIESDPQKRRIVICETLNRLVGVVTDSQILIEVFGDNEIHPPGFLTNKLEGRFINGVVKNSEGFTFLIDLESILDSIDPEEDENSQAKQKKYLTKKVLIVEDSRVLQKRVARMFMEMGFEVSVANDGVEGLQKLEERSDFDLILADIEMPQLNGIQMVREIKKNNILAKIPVIFHSSISNETLISQIIDEKLGSYITKFDISLISQAVSDALGE